MCPIPVFTKKKCCQNSRFPAVRRTPANEPRSSMTATFSERALPLSLLLSIYLKYITICT